MLEKWVKTLQENFSHDNVVVIEKIYFFSQKEVCKDIVQQVQSIMENDRETILIGHSFGGILALAAYQTAQHPKNITQIITLASPHSLGMFGIQETKNYIGYKNTQLENVQIKTFGGSVDVIVPNKYTKIKGVEHTTWNIGHNTFLLNQEIIEKVLKEI